MSLNQNQTYIPSAAHSTSTMAAAPDEDDNRFSLRGEMEKLFKASLELTFPGEEPCIVYLRNKEFGDYQCNNILSIWPAIRENRVKYKGCKYVGEDIIQHLPSLDMMEKCEVFGPGLIPFRLSRQWIAKIIHKMLRDGVDTWAPKLPVKRAIVDFSSRNIAEEMHMGHLRSTIIGDTLARMYEFSRVDVLRITHVGDWDIQLGILIEFLFERFPNEEVNNHTIGELEVLYKESKKRFDEDAEFKKRAQQAAVSLKAGDERYRNAKDKICEISRKGYIKMYKLLGVNVEEKGKSFYDPFVGETLKLLRNKCLIEKSEGDEVINIEKNEIYRVKFDEGKMIPLTIVKRDGCYDYALTDLAALWHGLKVEKADWILHVSDKGQREYTHLLITAAKRAEWLSTDEEEYPRTSHIGFDHVLGHDLKRFQTCSTEMVDLLDEAENHSTEVVDFLDEAETRSTEVVKLVDLLDEVKTRCKKALVERGKADEWTDEELEHTAEALGYSAVKYADLKNHRLLTKYKFNFDQMLDEKGNTAVYLVYAHAQICSFITKSGKNMEELKKTGELKLEKDEERELGLYLLQFTEVFEDTCRFVLPHILCEYLYKLAEKFTRFCENSSANVASAAEETTGLLLCEAATVVMKKCFHLLGITHDNIKSDL